MFRMQKGKINPQKDFFKFKFYVRRPAYFKGWRIKIKKIGPGFGFGSGFIKITLDQKH
jgi:hypothetical protein